MKVQEARAGENIVPIFGPTEKHEPICLNARLLPFDSRFHRKTNGSDEEVDLVNYFMFHPVIVPENLNNTYSSSLTVLRILF